MTKWFAPSGGLLPFGLDQVPGVRYVMMVLSISLSLYPKSLLEYFSFFLFLFGEFKLLYMAFYQGGRCFFLIFPTTVFSLLSNKAGHDNS